MNLNPLRRGGDDPMTRYLYANKTNNEMTKDGANVRQHSSSLVISTEEEDESQSRRNKSLCAVTAIIHVVLSPGLTFFFLCPPADQKEDKMFPTYFRQSSRLRCSLEFSKLLSSIFELGWTCFPFFEVELKTTKGDGSFCLLSHSHDGFDKNR